MGMNPEFLPGDSTEYEILYDAARSITHIPGMTCEIGLRGGGGTEVILRGQLDGGARRLHWHVAIDPYGNLPYQQAEELCRRIGYTSAMRRRALMELYALAATWGADVLAFTLTDLDFFARFADGVPLYEDGKRTVCNEYALVHFDGPHSFSAVAAEVRFFLPRTPVGGIWVFDDVDYYDHAKLEKVLPVLGFELFEKGEKKAAYRRAKVANFRPSKAPDPVDMMAL